MLIAKAYWQGAPFRFREAPPGVGATPLVLRTADFREVDGLLWTTPGPPSRLAVVAMHPRVDFTRHYLFPALLAAGVTCLGANSRNPNNDLDTVHEELVLDVAACVDTLRERGAHHVMLLGNSGGGSLAALYQSQALAAPEARLHRAPSGAPTRLRDAALSPADAMIYVGAHPGQGHILEECIDPSVSDEADPLATDTTLDMYAEANGFRPPPTFSVYEDEFVARFRAGQRARVARLDALARSWIEENRVAHRATQAPSFATLPWRERREIERRQHADRVMVIYRTMANLHYVDRALDPSPREYGSLLSDRPDLMNMKHLGFARVCTPRAWLSTWSGQSSNATMFHTLPRIDTPTLFVSAGADREIYPQSHTRPLVEAIAAADSTHVDLPEATHYFQEHRDELATHVTAWIRARFEAG